jgi:hypothetical protein
MQWTERHIVLLQDKQIFEVPPHRTGNIGPVRGARDPIGVACAYRASFAVFRFQEASQKFLALALIEC